MNFGEHVKSHGATMNKTNRIDLDTLQSLQKEDASIFFRNATAADVERLVKAGANPETMMVKNRGAITSMLHVAAEHSPSPEVVEVLIDLGADVNSHSGESGKVPLQVAASNPNALKIIKTLLNKGADPNAQDESGMTPLYDFASLEREDPGECSEAIGILIDAGASLYNTSNFCFTPLHIAAFSKNPPAVEALLDAWAEVNAMDAEGYTPLHFAFSFTHPENRDQANEIAIMLLDSGADAALQNKEGKTAFDIANEEKTGRLFDPALLRRMSEESNRDFTAAPKPEQGSLEFPDPAPPSPGM